MEATTASEEALMTTTVHAGLRSGAALTTRVRQLAALAGTPEGRAAVEHVPTDHGHVAGVFTADGEVDPAAVILSDLEHLLGPERLEGVLDLVVRQRRAPEDAEHYARARA